jgi:hypothetical protein
MAKSISVTTEFNQVTALFYFGRSLVQVPPILRPVPPVPPVPVSTSFFLADSSRCPAAQCRSRPSLLPMFEAVSDIYRLLSILHIPLKIEMLKIGGEMSIVNEVFCNDLTEYYVADLHCILD